jgi:hypothetical protein
LLSLKEQGSVVKIGVSIYAPSELQEILASYPIDIVQAPFNILDQHLVTSGWLSRLQDSGVEVHARSIFLQGLLLLNSEDRPAKFNRWQPLWRQWNSWLEDRKLSALQACLGFACSQHGIRRAVVGVDGVAQLREILLAVNCLPTVTPPPNLACDDSLLINPANWNKL